MFVFPALIVLVNLSCSPSNSAWLVTEMVVRQAEVIIAKKRQQTSKVTNCVFAVSRLLCKLKMLIYLTISVSVFRKVERQFLLDSLSILKYRFIYYFFCYCMITDHVFHSFTSNKKLLFLSFVLIYPWQQCIID